MILSLNTCIEHELCTRPCPRIQGHSNEQNRHKVLPHEVHRQGFLLVILRRARS